MSSALKEGQRMKKGFLFNVMQKDSLQTCRPFFLFSIPVRDPERKSADRNRVGKKKKGSGRM